jgi:hypothetical protein
MSAAAKQRPPIDGEGWIRHDGGRCPVDPSTPVHVRLRDGYDDQHTVPWLAGRWDDADALMSNWVHNDDPVDIMAFRIVGEPA